MKLKIDRSLATEWIFATPFSVSVVLSFGVPIQWNYKRSRGAPGGSLQSTPVPFSAIQQSKDDQRWVWLKGAKENPGNLRLKSPQHHAWHLWVNINDFNNVFSEKMDVAWTSLRRRRRHGLPVRAPNICRVASRMGFGNVTANMQSDLFIFWLE